jgi:hypothetical protein
MKTSPAVLVLALACAAATAHADDNATPATSSSATALKWTPHRPARVADASAGSPPATQATPQAAPEQAPPDASAAAPAKQAAAPESAPPPRQASVRPIPNYGANYGPDYGRMPPATVRPDPPVAPLTLPSIKFPAIPSIFSRSPQGEASRPMLASGDYQPPRIHGGRQPVPAAAPAYVDRLTAAAGRPTRLAMNSDDLPSVISRSDTPTPAGGPVTAAARPPVAAPTTPPPTTTKQPAAAETVVMPETAGTLEFATDMDGMPVEMASPSDGMWMGGYPEGTCHEPCIDDCCPEDECGFLPCCQHTGRVCGWMRQFGRPYYGWRWHRDFTASAGVTGFQTPADLGIAGNFGTNEYANFGMPFWNAFGVGWQLGVRGVQTHFQNTSIEGLTDDPFVSGARDQVFVTTGFYTRAFEGRGLQFGAVWDYLHDNWYDNVNLAQIRGEISYVWHAHEIGFWGASNYDTTPFSTRRFSGNASTMDLYALFYRLQFGDANEWKVWGGGTDNGDGYLGTLLRAPMTKSLALEGTFTYLIPKDTKTYPLGRDDDGDTVSITTADAAWNMSVNVVFYPACRSRRGLASPYRPLFEVADNGSMIRSLEGVGSTP